MKMPDDAVVRLSDAEAEAVVSKFEKNAVGDVTSDEIQLLERYFLDHANSPLGQRYEQALRSHIS